VLKAFQINFKLIVTLPVNNFTKITAKRIKYSIRLNWQSNCFTTAKQFRNSGRGSLLLPNITHEELLHFLQMILLLSKFLHEVFVLE
jgi:hypothetical protein